MWLRSEAKYRNPLSRDLVNGQIDPISFASLIDDNLCRQQIFNDIAENISGALERAAARGLLVLPQTCFPICEVLPQLLNLQIAGAAAWPQANWGPVRMSDSATAWSERIRLLLWSGTVNYAWGHETYRQDGFRWGIEAEKWKFRLMRQDPSLKRLIQWESSTPIISREAT
ncbi:MAG: hypothetical protein ABJN42_15920 [Roseibium sp.]|uniref:hypothetical protein n=1 Tax=Roseibium sp. TaxID=1936156 RepID=UPI0032976F3F